MAPCPRFVKLRHPVPISQRFRVSSAPSQAMSTTVLNVPGHSENGFTTVALLPNPPDSTWSDEPSPGTSASALARKTHQEFARLNAAALRERVPRNHISHLRRTQDHIEPKPEFPHPVRDSLGES